VVLGQNCTEARGGGGTKHRGRKKGVGIILVKPRGVSRLAEETASGVGGVRSQCRGVEKRGDDWGSGLKTEMKKKGDCKGEETQT